MKDFNKDNMRKYLVIFCIFFTVSSSFAALAPRMYSIMAQVNTGIFQSTDAAGSQYYNNRMSVDVLYLVRGGPTFGARYLLESRNENQTNSGEAYGPLVGYYGESGLFMVFNYDIWAKSGNWTNGEGFQFSLGYLEHFGNSWHIGAEISGRKIRYKTDITNSLAVSKDVTDYYPSISLMYLY